MEHNFMSCFFQEHLVKLPGRYSVYRSPHREVKAVILAHDVQMTISYREKKNQKADHNLLPPAVHSQKFHTPE